MPNMRSKRLAKRRDRRKAKAQGWKRSSKSSMSGGKVAHGGSGPRLNACNQSTGGGRVPGIRPKQKPWRGAGVIRLNPTAAVVND